MKKTDDAEFVLLIREFQTTKDNSILNTIVEKCEGMIIYALKKYYRMREQHDIEESDLKQELYFKLIKCIHNFPQNYDSFVQYAFKTLTMGVLNYFKYNTNRIDVNDYKTEQKFISLNSVTNDNEDTELLEMLEDENSLNEFEQIENEKISNYIRIMLLNIISDKDIDFLYDVYNINSDITFTNICIKYNISLNELICYERLLILKIQTNSKLDYYFEQFLKYSSGYTYSFSRWKYTHTSSTEHDAINNVMLQQKFERLLKPQILMSTLNNLITKCNDDNMLIFGVKIANEFDNKK